MCLGSEENALICLFLGRRGSMESLKSLLSQLSSSWCRGLQSVIIPHLSHLDTLTSLQPQGPSGATEVLAYSESSLILL